MLFFLIAKIIQLFFLIAKLFYFSIAIAFCGFLRQRGEKPCNHCISGAFANYEAHHFLTFPDLHERCLTFPDFRIRKNRIANDSTAFLCLALLSFAFVCFLLLLLCFRFAFGFDALRGSYYLCIHNVSFAEIFLSSHAKNSACRSSGSSFTFSTSVLTTNFLSKTGIFSSPVAYFLSSTAIPYADAQRNMTKNFPCVCKMFSICSQYSMALCCFLRHNEEKRSDTLATPDTKKAPGRALRLQI